MPQHDAEVEEVIRRTKTMRQIFPQIGQEEATELDKFLTDEVGAVLAATIERGRARQFPVGEAVVTSLFLMYIKSNVDYSFEKAFGNGDQ